MVIDLGKCRFSVFIRFTHEWVAPNGMYFAFNFFSAFCILFFRNIMRMWFDCLCQSNMQREHTFKYNIQTMFISLFRWLKLYFEFVWRVFVPSAIQPFNYDQMTRIKHTIFSAIKRQKKHFLLLLIYTIS